MQWIDRIENLKKVTGFPKALFMSDDGRVVGMVKSTNHRFRVITIFEKNSNPKAQ